MSVYLNISGPLHVRVPCTLMIEVPPHSQRPCRKLLLTATWLMSKAPKRHKRTKPRRGKLQPFTVKIDRQAQRFRCERENSQQGPWE